MSIMNTKEVSEFLKLSERSTYKLLKNPDCPTLKVGGEYKIIKEELIEYLKQCNIKKKS